MMPECLFKAYTVSTIRVSVWPIMSATCFVVSPSSHRVVPKVVRKSYGVYLPLIPSCSKASLYILLYVEQEQGTSFDFANMETFIGMCRDKDVRLKEIERIKALSKIQDSPYCYVRDWFLNHYANYSEVPQFDEEGYVVPKTKQEMEIKAIEKAETAPTVPAEEIDVATMAA